MHAVQKIELALVRQVCGRLGLIDSPESAARADEVLREIRALAEKLARESGE